MLDIVSGVSEARLLHPAQDGWFALLRKKPGAGRPIQTMYEMRMLDAVANAMQSQPDAYISQASFMAKQRKESFLYTIRSVYVDIDCYKLGVEPDEHLIKLVVAKACAAGMPEPSYVVGSGRGLYAKWVFDRPIGASKMLEWKLLQSTLLALYRSVGSDPSARDSSRVLRLVGSLNSKAPGRDVRVEFNSNKLYAFDELYRLAGQIEFGDDKRAQAAARVHINRIANSSKDMQGACGDLANLTLYAARKEPVMMKRMTLQSLYWNRFLDLRTLAMKRGGVFEGSRDVFLFWMISFLAHAGVISEGNFYEEAGELARTMEGEDFRPLEDGSLSTLVERVRQQRAGLKVEFRGVAFKPLYTPSNEYLVDALSITDDEMTDLKVIMSSAEVQRRRDAKVEGRAERRQARVDWRVKALELLQAGQHSPAEVATLVGKHRSQISRLMAGRLATTKTMLTACEAQAKALLQIKPQVVLEAGQVEERPCSTPAEPTKERDSVIVACADHDASACQPAQEENTNVVCATDIAHTKIDCLSRVVEAIEVNRFGESLERGRLLAKLQGVRGSRVKAS